MKELLDYIKGFTKGKYISVPSFLIFILKYVSRLRPVYNIKFKLIGGDWYYDLTNLEKNFKLNLSDTYTNLDKYINWYLGVINGNS